MAFIEYILLALIGSTGAAAPGAAPARGPARTLDAGALSQPRGGAMGDISESVFPNKNTGSKTTSGKKATKTSARRHHRRRPHQRRAADSGKKATKQ